MQVPDLDEGEKRRRQAEVKVDPHFDMVEVESLTDHEVRGGRQRGPATIRVGVTPTDPGGSPDAIRKPDPAAGRVQLPPAIVKRGPTPGIVRVPIPPAIAVDPASAMAIRTPGTVDDHDLRLPAPTQPSQFNPGPIRFERVVKRHHVWRRVRDIDRLPGRRRRIGGWREQRWDRVQLVGDRRRCSWLGPALAQRRVVTQHGREDGLINPEILQIDDALSRELERGLGTFDISENQFLIRCRFGQANHLRRVGGETARSRGGIGWRIKTRVRRMGQDLPCSWERRHAHPGRHDQERCQLEKRIHNHLLGLFSPPVEEESLFLDLFCSDQ